MKSKRAICATAAFALIVFASQQTYAWWIDGHRLCARAAVKLLPEEMPQFFREGADEIAGMIAEPDNWKHVSTPHVRAAEQPEHFIDLEYLEGAPVPEMRYELIALYQTKKVDPNKGGFLPCAIQEGYERLMLAFREYRTNPEAKGLKSRILVYGGWLAHYCTDAAMPLHTTKDYDGRKDETGKFVQKGIHARIDGYPEKNNFTPELISQDVKLEDPGKVWTRILKTIDSSNKLVEKCYELDAASGFDKAPEKGRELILERTREAAKFTAEIWLAAWRNSDPAKATVPQPK